MPADYNFEKVYQLSKTDDKQALRYYAKNSREILRQKFPNSKFDDTTIINGVIFINEKNEPSLDQSVLFKLCLKDIKDYEKKNGNLDNISKNFKTKLYETFLRPYLRGMGQYFTPRKIIQTMINMSEVANLKINKNSEVKIIDPFCGVGGFISEIINLNPEFEKIFSSDSYKNKVELKGYDKGSSDRDSERTIILAKANLLIYLSDIFSKNLEVTKTISQRINDIFRLHRTNLGTLGIINEEKYNFIFTNPPYLSSGIKPIIEEIKLLEAKIDKNKKFYTVNCGSLETYCLQWIIKSLAPSGKAYVILPDSVFKGSKTKEIREFIRTNCFIEAIIKLPNKTFYTTSDKKTYILILEKKNDISSEKQDSYIFTYLLSDIGEKLNSKARESISANDCPELEMLFSSFSNNKSKIKSNENLEFFSDYFLQEKLKKLKLLPQSFLGNEEWIIDLEYEQDLLIKFGFSPKEKNVSLNNFYSRIEKTQEKIKEIKNNVEDLKLEISKNLLLANEENDFWECVYEHGKGNSKLTKEYIKQNKGNCPVYSSAFKNPELGRINNHDIDSECIQLIKNADAGRVIYRIRQKMSYNGDCWMLSIREEYKEKLLLKYMYYYLKYCLQIHKKYDWNYKITKKNFLLVFKPKIKFPSSLEIQKKMVSLWNQIEEKESSLNILINDLKEIKEIFVI